MSDTFKRIGILTILMFVVVLAVGEQTGTFDISDSEGAMFGAVYDSQGNPVYGSDELQQKDDSVMAIIAAQKEYCIGEKSYHTYYATSVHSSDYYTEEKKLWDKVRTGISCSVRQQIITPTGAIKGSFHILSEIAFGGATAYSAGSLYFIPQVSGLHTYYVQATCADSVSIWIVDAKQFNVENCADDTPSLDDLIKACDAKDTDYCSGSYLYVKDYEITNGICAPITKYVDNEVCYDKWKADVCADNGYDYDATTNNCIKPPVVTPEPTVPTQPEDPIVDIPPQNDELCDLYPELCEQPPADEDIEQMSWLEANKGVLIVSGFVIVGMLILFGAILVRRLKK